MICDPQTARIAFLGLGKMGLPMASRLVARGWNVVAFDPVGAARSAFEAAAGRTAATASDAAAGSTVLITMLPDGNAVRSLLRGEGAILGSLSARAILVDMSSSDPIGTRDLASELIRSGFELVDAPVSGGVKRAVDGSLAIMVGGSKPAIAAVRPILESMGQSLFETGPIGSGHAMKALNNYVSAAGLTAACEALQIGERFGLDPTLMADILNVSTGRNNSTEVKLKPFVIPKSYASGFSLGLMAKDLHTADELARRLAVPAPFSRACSTLWSRALAELGPQADHTAINAFLAKPE